MFRRRSTLTALLAAALLGMAESTGTAPLPPVEVDQEIHWLSPALDDDGEIPLEFVENDLLSVPLDPSVEQLRPPRSMATRAWDGLARLLGRT